VLVALLQRGLLLDRGLQRSGSFVNSLLQRFTPRTVFMEIGAGDCSLALLAASYVERVYAVDPAKRIVDGRLPPLNLRLLLSDEDTGIPVPEGSVDLAFSARPTAARLRLARQCLASGGLFVTSDLGSRQLALEAGFARVRQPWFEPVIVAVTIEFALPT